MRVLKTEEAKKVSGGLFGLFGWGRSWGWGGRSYGRGWGRGWGGWC